jgi:hypothetical protein
MNRTVTQNAPIGAINLLEHCLDARAGQTLLIVGEEGPEAHFDRALCDQVARAAGERGIDARVVIAPVTSTASEIPFRPYGRPDTVSGNRGRAFHVRLLCAGS